MASRQEQLEYVLDLANNPTRLGTLDDASISLTGGNPGCGDVATVFLKINPETQVIEDLRYEMAPESCTISKAGVSYISEEVIGLTLDQLRDIHFDALMDELGRDVVSSRPRCATLGLGTIHAAADEYERNIIRADLARERAEAMQ
jgi:nitrogen fixation protein NifU and related proteins